MSDRAYDARSEQDIEPISQAVHQLATSFHDEIVRDLGRSTSDQPVGLEDRLALHQRTYPHLLFGELAMYLAGIELPPNATAPDRARGIVEALRRISTTPSLFEAITNAPYTKELATGLIPELPKSVERDNKEISEAISLQKRVAQAGYLERSMIPDKRVVQLQYTTVSTVKQRRRGRHKTNEAAVMTLKIVPANEMGWTVKRYNHWDAYAGYTGYIDNRRVNEQGIFTLIAASSSAEVPSGLEKLIGSFVKIGQVSTGTQLKLKHTFRRASAEVPGHETEVSFQTLSLPANLSQAYLGDLTGYPLFS